MNSNHYKLNEFASLINVSIRILSYKIYDLRKYKNRIKEDDEVEKSLQNRN